MLEARGFVRVDTVRLHPMQLPADLGTPLHPVIADLLSKEQDCSIVGYKR